MRNGAIYKEKTVALDHLVNKNKQFINNPVIWRHQEDTKEDTKKIQRRHQEDTKPNQILVAPAAQSRELLKSE